MFILQVKKTSIKEMFIIADFFTGIKTIEIEMCNVGPTVYYFLSLKMNEKYSKNAFMCINTSKLYIHRLFKFVFFCYSLNKILLSLV